MKEVRIDASRSPQAGNAVFPFDPPADPFRIPEEPKRRPDDRLLSGMPFKYEVEILHGGPKPAEGGKDGIFAAQSDIERPAGKRGERSHIAVELQPGRRSPLGREQDEIMPSPDEGVPDLEIAAHAAENLDVGKKSGDPHDIQNVARGPSLVNPLRGNPPT